MSKDSFDFSYDQDELLLVGDSLIDQKGLISHHLDSANNFYKNGIAQIISGFTIEKDIINRRNITDEDNDIQWIKCSVKPKNIVLTPPKTLHYKTGKVQVLYPTAALVQDKFYSGNLSFDADIKAVAYYKNGDEIERTDTISNFQISKIPIVKGSILCNTYKMSKEALKRINEDPSDPGGYFVVRGEWAVDCTENSTYNQPKIYNNEGYKKSRVRCEFISKPGDAYQNSEQIIISYYDNNTLTIEISRDKLNKVEIPFFLIFRALGWNTDKEMMDWIVYEYDNSINKELIELIKLSIRAPYTKAPKKSKQSEVETGKNYKDIYNQTDAIRAIIDMVPPELYKGYDLANKPENYHNAINDILRIFDTYCLPHIGMSEKHRNNKLKYLGLLIRKVYLVWLKYIPQTDRDSYRNKRIHAVGENYAKTFKTFFNQTVVMPIKRRMIKDFNATPFSQVNLSNLVKNAIYADDFERLIVQTIISGNKSTLKIKKRTITNRLSSQFLNRKNQLNIFATMRQIASTSAESAKQSERAMEMRRVHMSQIGYTCVSHSPPEGEKVGINKQMACFSFIAPPSNSEVLKQILLKDKDIILDDDTISPKYIFINNLSRVFVNGMLIGYTTDSIRIITKYRQLRRELKINPYTTIYWDNVQDEVQFFVDIGRLARPLLIVYNNKRDKTHDKSKKEFSQGLAITSDDIKMLYTKEKTINDLLKEQKIEYITPEEQENYYLCASFEELKKNRYNETKEYTHCDIPQSIIGITALTAPFANHNQAPRVTYQTTQGKQTCGFYSLNWPYRVDKETFLQYVNEEPLIKTLSNKYLFSNGNNVMVAIACYTGFNQEDSLIINKAAIDRGLFNGSKFTFINTDFEQKEELGTPDVNTTNGIKSANYNKLVNGIIPIGTVVKKDDVVIGKYSQIQRSVDLPDNNYKYIDRSIVYRSNEDAIVHKIINGRDEDGKRIVKVALRKTRPVSVGDKFSSRSGQKGICALLMRESDMPTTIDGIRPSLIFNPHGMPSRMTCAQLIESLLGNICAIKGTTYDATMFKKVSIESISEELEKLGYNKYGYEKMISGITGEFIDTLIFFGPTYYQRLQKFVADAEYSVRHALTDAVTMQPLDGQGSSGGLKIGEMEKDVLVSHGASMTLKEKFFNHSDGYVEYICTCGKPAIVNHHHNTYKCDYCGDLADIKAVPTSYTSKLFFQELESIGIGIKRRPKPFTFIESEK